MIDDCLFCRCRGVSCVQGVRMIDDCSFCRCRGHSCVQGVRMIDDLFVLWMSWSFLCSWSSLG